MTTPRRSLLPFRLAALVACALLVAAPPGRAEGESNLRGALDLIQRGYADGTLHGVAAVMSPGEPTLYGTSGVAGPGGAKLERASRFRIASLTKVVVQLALLRLVDQGRLDIDEPLATYRPSLGADWAETVTIRQLITFRSGLPRERPGATPIESGVVYDENGAALPFLDTLGELGPTVAPGSQTAYSNLGYMHLGGVLEAVCEKPIEGALRELVLEPAGMTSSGLLGADELDGERHVAGHRRADDGTLQAVGSFPVSVRYTAGGMYSSLEDLERLSIAVLGSTFLRPPSRALFFSGFGRDDDGRVRVAGRVPGFANAWLLSSDPPFAIVMLNNAVGDSPDAIVSLLDQAGGRLAPNGSAGSGTAAAIEDEGWKRVPSLKAVPAHPLLATAEGYIAALDAPDATQLFDRSVRARGLDPAELSENDRKGYQFVAQVEFDEFHAYGPFRVAAWRPGEADRLEIYLEGPEGRAIFYRFRPDPQDPKRALSIAYGTVGFKPDREPNPYFQPEEK